MLHLIIKYYYHLIFSKFLSKNNCAAVANFGVLLSHVHD